VISCSFSWQAQQGEIGVEAEGEPALAVIEPEPAGDIARQHCGKHGQVSFAAVLAHSLNSSSKPCWHARNGRHHTAKKSSEVFISGGEGE